MFLQRKRLCDYDKTFNWWVKTLGTWEVAIRAIKKRVLIINQWVEKQDSVQNEVQVDEWIENYRSDAF